MRDFLNAKVFPMDEPTATVLSRTPSSTSATPDFLSQPPRWSVWGERFLLLALVFLFVYKGFVPAWKQLNTDFPNYYIAARLYREGYPMARVYEWTWFQRQKDHLGVDQRIVNFNPLTLAST